MDRLSEIGAKGSGWRAAQGDPQWISVDLQAPCRVESVVLIFEATLSEPTFVGSSGRDPRDNTTGFEVLSGCRGRLHRSMSPPTRRRGPRVQHDVGTGGVTTITLPKPVTARWVRMTVAKRSNGNPLGLNGFEVYGTCDRQRPAGDRLDGLAGAARPRCPRCGLAADGTVPIESGWNLTLDDWVGRRRRRACCPAPRVDTSGWLPAHRARHGAGVPGRAGPPARSGHRLEQPAGARGALAAIPGGTGGPFAFPHELRRLRRPARVAGVRRHQPPGRRLAQRCEGRRAGASVRPRRARRHRAARPRTANSIWRC